MLAGAGAAGISVPSFSRGMEIQGRKSDARVREGARERGSEGARERGSEGGAVASAASLHHMLAEILLTSLTLPMIART